MTAPVHYAPPHLSADPPPPTGCGLRLDSAAVDAWTANPGQVTCADCKHAAGRPGHGHCTGCGRELTMTTRQIGYDAITGEPRFETTIRCPKWNPFTATIQIMFNGRLHTEPMVLTRPRDSTAGPVL